MLKIGFIDLFIDEWHANNYPKMIRESRFRDAFAVAMAWEEAPRGGKPLEAWCAEHKVTPAVSIEQVVRECDRLIVLAPGNPEAHERLADPALRSGKPLYIDKPFAPDAATARRIFEKASLFKTPLMSCSALRFGSALQKTAAETRSGTQADFAAIRGGGRSFEEYAIHQIEMLVMTMGLGAARVMQCGAPGGDVMMVEYPDGRRATISRIPPQGFSLILRQGGEKHVSIPEMSDFFPRFIDGMLDFFSTGVSPVPPEETVEIAALLDAGIRALSQKDAWIPAIRS